MKKRKQQIPARKRCSGGAGAKVTLFPFMAVLLCTMGSLILMLVIITRNVRDKAIQASETVTKQPEVRLEDPHFGPVPESKIAEIAGKYEEETGNAAWFAQGYKDANESNSAELEKQKSKLTALEEEIRKIREISDRMKQAVEMLENKPGSSKAELESLENELRNNIKLLEEKKRQIAALQNEQKNRKKAYAIIPFEGRNKTQRYPIYIECKKDSIVIRPHGIELFPMDFAVAGLKQGADFNPLDSAIRSATAYLRETGMIGPEENAYPLLLLRPSGIEAYSVAWRFMVDSGNEFGYELLEEDWEVAYPKAGEEMTGRMIAQVTRTRTEVANVLMAMSMQARNDGEGDVYRFGATARPQLIERRKPAEEGGSWASPTPLTASRQVEIARRIQDAATPNRNETAAPGVRAEIMPAAAENRGEPRNELARNDNQDQRQPHGNQRKNDVQNPPANAAPRKMERSLAETRGENWGLQGADAHSFEITRAVKINLQKDRLVLPRQGGLRVGQTVMINGSMRDATIEFATKIKDFMESWGTAGDRRYWRPVLKIKVTPEAGENYSQLEELLHGSGFLLEREAE